MSSAHHAAVETRWSADDAEVGAGDCCLRDLHCDVHCAAVPDSFGVDGADAAGGRFFAGGQAVVCACGRAGSAGAAAGAGGARGSGGVSLSGRSDAAPGEAGGWAAGRPDTDARRALAGEWQGDRGAVCVLLAEPAEWVSGRLPFSAGGGSECGSAVVDPAAKLGAWIGM